MDRPTFTFKQVDAILSATFKVAPGKRRTFTARLQQLQKLGIPPGSNTGRGTRAQYASWQLCDMLFALDLLQTGVSPGLIAARYGGDRTGGFFGVDGAGRFAESAFANGQPYYAYVRLNALAALTMSGDLDVSSPGFNEVTTGYDLNQVVANAAGTPGVLIDLAARIGELRAAIAVHSPEFDGFDLFQHYPQV